MNKELFRSMQAQLRPSEGARAALTEKLRAGRRRTVPRGRQIAAAACAAVILAAPVYGAVSGRLSWREIVEGFRPGVAAEVQKPHSYVAAGDAACWPAEDAAAEENSTDAGRGDQDMDMAPSELTEAMREAGLSQEDAEAYLAAGWQMTWAKWWKFIHLSEETGDRSLEALLDFSEGEGLAVNTGLAPEEGVDQSAAVAAYQNLMARFEADYGPDAYPAWYGGAYIDGHGGLIVNIVDAYSREGDDKALCLQIQDWAGSDRVGFGSSRYGLGELRRLQDEAFRAMSELGLAVGCGVNEQTGQVELTLSSVTDEALWRLAELDPADDAILVLAGQVPAVDGGAEEPAVSHAIQPGGVVPADEDGAIAWEPQDPQMPCVDEVIQTEPREENTAAYDPLA